jgi:UPF0176 protein
MAVHKVILFYGFTPVSDPVAVRMWQRLLCEAHGLKGRILISKHGINGTLGGEVGDLKRYVRATKQYPGFNKIDFKWAPGTGKEFPKLKVNARKELVSFGLADEIQVDENGVVNGGVHLKPAEVNKLVAERGDDIIFFDGRNAYESRIGKFKNALVPDTVTTRDFINEIESGKYDAYKDKPIVTYCTGGVRCEILSVAMKNRGFKEVYQIEGGVVRYGEQFKNDELWLGSLYTFDGRMTVNFSKNPQVLGECDSCSSPTSEFTNCQHPDCIQLMLLCENCGDWNRPENCYHDRNRMHDKAAVG